MFYKKKPKYPNSGIYHGFLGPDNWVKKIVISGGSNKPESWEGINNCYFYIADPDFKVTDLVNSWHTHDNIPSNEEDLAYSPMSQSFASNFEPLLKKLEKYKFLNSYVAFPQKQDELNLNFSFYNPDYAKNKKEGLYETLVLAIHICKKQNEKHTDMTPMFNDKENIKMSIKTKLAEYIHALENGIVKFELDKITTASVEKTSINLGNDTDIYTATPKSSHYISIK